MNIDNELVLQLDINFYGLKIHQFTIGEIFEYGLEEYNNLLIPFSLTFDMFEMPLELHDKYKIFDLIISNQQLCSMLIYSIKFFCKIDNIQIVSNGLLINNTLINRDNFDELCEVILKIHARKLEKEDETNKEGDTLYHWYGCIRHISSYFSYDGTNKDYTRKCFTSKQL
jgi:hypothetical protein